METTPRTENERPSEKVTWEQAISLLSSAAGISLIYLSPSLCLLDVLRIKETGLGLHLGQDSPRTGHFISPSGGRSPPLPQERKGTLAKISDQPQQDRKEYYECSEYNRLIFRYCMYCHGWSLLIKLDSSEVTDRKLTVKSQKNRLLDKLPG